MVRRVTEWSGSSVGGRVSGGGLVSAVASLPCCRLATWLAPFAFAARHCFVKQARDLVAAREFNTFPQDEDGNISLPSLHPTSSALYNTIRRKKKSIDSPNHRSTITELLLYSCYNTLRPLPIRPGGGRAFVVPGGVSNQAMRKGVVQYVPAGATGGCAGLCKNRAKSPLFGIVLMGDSCSGGGGVGGGDCRAGSSVGGLVSGGAAE